uniref:Uncharacterized protein n=1 Tax=Arundo donax TaxID=35708 RepID=A0A0A9EF03_ARUDO
MNQQDRPRDASGQHEDGITMSQESSDLDLTRGDIPPTNQPDKSQEGVGHALGQRKDGNTMPQESSDHDVTADKENNSVWGQQKDNMAEPRGKKHFREEDGRLSSLDNPTFNAELAEKKRSGTEQANLNSDPLPYNLGDFSHDLEEKSSCGHKEPWTSKGTDVTHCVESMKENDRRPASNGHYLDKRKYEVATSTVSTEYEACF